MGYAAGEKQPLRSGKSRSDLQPFSVLLCILLPPLVYVGIYVALSFEFRHNLGLAISSKFPVDPHQASRGASFLVGPLIGIIACTLLTAVAYTRVKRGKVARTFVVLAATLWVAVLSGWVQGDANYWTYMATYYNINDLDTYINVDPATDKGQTFMDAGQVYFKEGTEVLTANANAFMQNGVYCVAPIVRKPLVNQGGTAAVDIEGTFKAPPSGTIDFWAVGVNCCDPTGAAFKCGDAENPTARSGLRMIRDDQRAFFYMAVQEWSAKFNLPAKHPLFFYYVQNPLKEVEDAGLRGQWNFYSELLSFVVFNLVAAIVLQLTCQKFGVL